MRIKTGPLLVIVALVALVGLAIMLSPAPPPAPEGEREQEAPEPARHEEEPEPPTITFAQARKLIDSSDAKEQQAGLQALGDVIVARRHPELREFQDYTVELARHGQTEAARLAAAALLRAIPSVDAKFLIDLARSDPSPAVRRIATLDLAEMPPGPEVDQALRELQRSSDPAIRNAAVVGLTQIMTKSGQAGLEGLISVLGERDNDAGAKAAMALEQQATMGNNRDRVLAAVVKALYASDRPEQREGAALTIAMICAGFNPSILAFAKSARATHRQEGAKRPADPAGVEPLLWALRNDPYAPTRSIAAQGLGYLGDARAAGPLAAALKDPAAEVRRRAAFALVTVPADSVVPQLAEAATSDESPDVRKFAVEALGWVGKTEVVPALKQATQDRSPAVRRAAATELGRLADPGGMEALVKLLGPQQEPDADVRWAAVVALEKLRDPRSAKYLLAALSDPSPQVSNSAERALQKLGIARREEAGFEG